MYKATSRWKANRKRKLEKLLKQHPNNKQIELALQSMVYRRKTPNSRVWSASMIREAKLFKEFAGYVNRDIFSSNEKLRGEARLQNHRKHFGELPQGRVDFSLGARAMTKVSSVAQWN